MERYGVRPTALFGTARRKELGAQCEVPWYRALSWVPPAVVEHGPWVVVVDGAWACGRWVMDISMEPWEHGPWAVGRGAPNGAGVAEKEPSQHQASRAKRVRKRRQGLGRAGALGAVGSSSHSTSQVAGARRGRSEMRQLLRTWAQSTPHQHRRHTMY